MFHDTVAGTLQRGKPAWNLHLKPIWNSCLYCYGDINKLTCLTAWSDPWPYLLCFLNNIYHKGIVCTWHVPCLFFFSEIISFHTGDLWEVFKYLCLFLVSLPWSSLSQQFDTDVSWEFHNRGISYMDWCLTLHWCYWIFDCSTNTSDLLMVKC